MVSRIDGKDFWQRLPGNLTTNQFTWTPELEAGARNVPQIEGNDNDFLAKFEAGDSV